MKLSNYPSEEPKVLYSSPQIETMWEITEQQYKEIEWLIVKQYKDELEQEIKDIPNSMREIWIRYFVFQKLKDINVQVINKNWFLNIRWFWGTYKELYYNNPSLLVVILNIIAWKEYFLYDTQLDLIVYIWPWSPDIPPPNNRVKIIKEKTNKILISWSADDYKYIKAA